MSSKQSTDLIDALCNCQQELQPRQHANRPLAFTHPSVVWIPTVPKKPSSPWPCFPDSAQCLILPVVIIPPWNAGCQSFISINTSLLVFRLNTAHQPRPSAIYSPFVGLFCYPSCWQGSVGLTNAPKMPGDEAVMAGAGAVGAQTRLVVLRRENQASRVLCWW